MISPTPLRVVVTGATGFVGSEVVRILRARGHEVCAWTRQSCDLDVDAERLASAQARWCEQLHAVDIVVHLAARVHQFHESPETDAAHHRINTRGTVALAQAAQIAGVKRFVFLSTAKIYGEGRAEPYCESTAPVPQDVYGRSKLEAERELFKLTQASNFEIVVLRPPLVYGVAVRGNFARLWRLAASPWPLPIAAVDNRRDMIAVTNLADVVALCCEDPRAAGQIFNVADAAPYALPAIVAAIRKALHRRKNLWSMPPSLLRMILQWTQGKGTAHRLLDDFSLDTAHVREVLGWRPRDALPEVAAAMAQDEHT